MESIRVIEDRGPAPNRGGGEAAEERAAGPSFQRPGAEMSAHEALPQLKCGSPPFSQCQGAGYQSLHLRRQYQMLYHLPSGSTAVGRKQLQHSPPPPNIK